MRRGALHCDVNTIRVSVPVKGKQIFFILLTHVSANVILYRALLILVTLGIFISGSNASAQANQCRIIARGLNFRSGPGVNFAPPIRSLPNQTLVTPLSRNSESTWIRVRTGDTFEIGWVSASPDLVLCDISISSLPITSDTFQSIPECVPEFLDCGVSASAQIPPSYRLNSPVAEESVNTFLPGSRPVVIVVSFAHYELIARSSITWGYTNTNGQFVSGGLGVLDHNGGVLRGEIPAGDEVNEITVTASVDYVNPALQDEVGVYTVSVGVSGVNAIVGFGFTTHRILLSIDGYITGQDYLELEWSVSSESTPQGQTRVEWLSPSSLITATEQPLTRTLVVPTLTVNAPGSRQTTDHEVIWTLSGFLSGSEVLASGIIPSDQHAMLIRIDSNLNVWVNGIRQSQ